MTLKITSNGDLNISGNFQISPGVPLYEVTSYSREPTNFEKVVEFTRTYGQAEASYPTLTPYNDPEKDQKLKDLRIELIDEEFNRELKEAVEANDIVAVADALTDILYVVYGAGVAWGIPLDECLAEVHRSNMSKIGPDGKPIYREDGKVLKGPNYSPPNLEKILFPEDHGYGELPGNEKDYEWLAMSEWLKLNADHDRMPEQDGWEFVGGALRRLKASKA